MSRATGMRVYRAEELVGRVIKTVRFKNDQLNIVFTDGLDVFISDNGQDCCESRWMTCGEDEEGLAGYSGAKMLGLDILKIDLSPGDGEGETYGVHDVEFLHVRTTLGSITCETHNEHNGYYGGFNVEIRG